MRTTQADRIRAEQLSAAVDQLLRNPDTQPGRIDPADAELLDTAHELARLPALLGPVDPALEQQVMRRVRSGTGRAPSRPALKLGWAVAGLAALLLVAALWTPLGQTAMASFLAVFHLGRTEVRIAPSSTSSALPATVVAGSTAVQESLSLEQAQEQVAFAIRQPAYRPPGYALREVKGYTYPDLPAWVPQPFFIELVYGDDAGHKFTLRLYPITLGEDAATTGMNLESSAIRRARDVDVDGQPGVLLQVGDSGAGVIWQELVWEQGDLILSLTSTNLTEAEMLRIARSVRPGATLPPASGLSCCASPTACAGQAQGGTEGGRC